MSEINEVKRIYERRVRLDYLKTNVPEDVARATNVDTALRNWQMTEAEKSGLKNLGEINKETQATKKLMDALGKENAGIGGNNALGLTDAILIAGGSSESIASLLVKKTLSDKGLQSFVAKNISKNKEKIGVPQAQFKEKLQLPPPKEGQPKVSNDVPIKVGKSQSKADANLQSMNAKKGSQQSQGKVKIVSPPNPTTPKKKVNSVPVDKLEQEAKKYKSAEEFVKAQEPNLVYHGSTVPLKSFNNKSGTFFTDDMMNADGYGNGENVYEGVLNLKKPLIIDAKGKRYDNLNTPYGKSTREIVGNVDSKKYDGVIFKNIKDSFSDGEEAEQVAGTISYAFKPKDAFLNESQLTDLWKKANKK